MTDEEKIELSIMIEASCRKIIEEYRQQEYKTTEQIDRCQVLEVSETQNVIETESIKAITKNNNNEKKEAKLIAIAGTKSGVGVTHHAILIAKSLCQSEKVALLDMSESHSLSELKENHLSNFDLFLNGDLLQLDKILYDYDVIIIDLGCYTEEIESIFNRCDQQIIITGGQPWDMKYLTSLFTKLNEEHYILFNHVHTAKRKDFLTLGMSPLSVAFAAYTPEPITEEYENPLNNFVKNEENKKRKRWRM